MALPLALFHPASLFGIQLLVAAAVFAAVWFFTKGVLKSSGFSILALILTAVATTLVARVPPYPDPKTAKPSEQKMPSASILLGLLTGPFVFFVYLTLTSLMLQKYSNSNRDMEYMYIPIGVAGIAMTVSWFFTTVFHHWRSERAKADATASSKASPKKPPLVKR